MKKTKTIFFVFIILITVFGYFFVSREIGSSAFKLPVSFSFQENSAGCGNIFVYKINNDDTVGISVSAGKEKLNLSTIEKTFEVAKTEDLSIEILVGKNIERLYCNDIFDPDQPKPKKLIGKSGLAIISISNDNKSKPDGSEEYKATVTLKNVHFFNDNGTESNIVIDELIFKDVTVGWYAG